MYMGICRIIDKILAPACMRAQGFAFQYEWGDCFRSWKAYRAAIQGDCWKDDPCNSGNYKADQSSMVLCKWKRPHKIQETVKIHEMLFRIGSSVANFLKKSTPARTMPAAYLLAGLRICTIWRWRIHCTVSGRNCRTNSKCLFWACARLRALGLICKDIFIWLYLYIYIYLASHHGGIHVFKSR